MNMALHIERVTKEFGDYTAVDDLTFRVPQGEMFGLLGANGAGKTTLLSTLAGLREPSAGHVELDGVRMSAWHTRQLAQRRALMPQSA
ncbi:ATP-binding cassette domain-containing protein, partial [Paraburkholderia sp. SIMBA_055]